MMRKTKKRAERPKNLFPERDFRGRAGPAREVDMRSNKIFVTGATGFIGRALVQRLLKEGWEVVGLARDPAKTWKQKGLHWVFGDIRDASWHPAVQGCRVLIHAAGVHGYLRIPWKERVSIELTGTKNVITAAVRYKVSYIIYINTAYAGLGTEYGRIKQLPLQWIQARMRLRLPATVIQPMTVYGPGDLGNTLRVFQAVARGRFAFIGNGETPVWFLYIDDLVDGLLRVLNHQKQCVGKTLTFGPKTAASWVEIARLIARVEGVPAPRWHLPKAMMEIAGAVGTLLSRFGMPVPFTSDTVTMLTAHMNMDTKEADRLLGKVATTDLAKGIAQTIAWYQEHKLV